MQIWENYGSSRCFQIKTELKKHALMRASDFFFVLAVLFALLS